MIFSSSRYLNYNFLHFPPTTWRGRDGLSVIIGDHCLLTPHTYTSWPSDPTAVSLHHFRTVSSNYLRASFLSIFPFSSQTAAEYGFSNVNPSFRPNPTASPQSNEHCRHNSSQPFCRTPVRGQVEEKGKHRTWWLFHSVSICRSILRICGWSLVAY